MANLEAMIIAGALALGVGISAVAAIQKYRADVAEARIVELEQTIEYQRQADAARKLALDETRKTQESINHATTELLNAAHRANRGGDIDAALLERLREQGFVAPDATAE